MRLHEAHAGKDWPEKPVRTISEMSYVVTHGKSQNDALSWLIDGASKEELNPENLILKLLFLGFASLHSSNSVSLLSCPSLSLSAKLR